MVRYYGRARQRVGSVNTLQLGLKMAGCPSNVGRKGVQARSVQRRVQCNLKVCGWRPIHGVPNTLALTQRQRMDVNLPQGVAPGLFNMRLQPGGPSNGRKRWTGPHPCVLPAPKSQARAGGVGNIRVPRDSMSGSAMAGAAVVPAVSSAVLAAAVLAESPLRRGARAALDVNLYGSGFSASNNTVTFAVYSGQMGDITQTVTGVLSTLQGGAVTYCGGSRQYTQVISVTIPVVGWDTGCTEGDPGERLRIKVTNNDTGMTSSTINMDSEM